MAASSQTLIDGEKNAVVKLVNLFTGASDESAVTKVDVSALNANSDGVACSGVSIKRITGDIFGVGVELLWDADTDVTILKTGDTVASTSFDHDYTKFGGLQNNAGAGVTGDIKLTTNGAGAGDFYTIVLELSKKYG